jgi:hypothetical protein
VDPDPGGPNTRGSGSGFGSATLIESAGSDLPGIRGESGKGHEHMLVQLADFPHSSVLLNILCKDYRKEIVMKIYFVMKFRLFLSSFFNDVCNLSFLGRIKQNNDNDIKITYLTAGE